MLLNSIVWVGEQAPKRSAGPLSRHRSAARTSERGGEGYSVKEGGGEEGERERERAVKVRLCNSLGYRG